MRSAEELDAELTRTRRSMRRLMVGTTLGVAVGLGIIATVVGATLAVVDKRAAEMLVAPPRKASAPASSKVEQASKPVDAPRATTAQAPAATPPVIDTTAPATTAPRSASVSPSPPPAPAAQADEAKRTVRGDSPRDAKRAERDAARTIVKRTHDETDGAAPRDGVTRDDGRDRTGRRVVRVRPADQDVAEEPPERVTIIQRPGYARPQLPPVADEGDRPRGGGLFGFIFGRHGEED